MEVQIEEALEVAECTLVGRARGKKFTSNFIKAWGEQNWQSDLIRGFEVLTLVKGWFMVRFEHKEAIDWVVEKNWAFGNIPVLLKNWSPLFDAVHEKTDVFPVWVRAPRLPSFLWVESVFKAIGNKVGTFLEANMSFKQTQNKVMARILVSLNPSRGLAKKINLQYKDFVFEQILDYEYFPFRGQTSNVVNQDPQLRRANKDLELGGAKAIMEITVETPATQNSIESEGAKGMCLDPKFSPILNSKINKDRLVPKSPSKNFISNINELIESHERNTVENCIEIISAAIPSLDLNCEGASTNPIPPAHHPTFPYNLRSLDNKPNPLDTVGGIGFSPPPSLKRKKRGRKSNLSMAQIKGKHDVADGK
eukprot:PITA_24932